MIHAFRYTEELEKVGFSTEQAKKSVEIWMELMDQNFATKADFKEHYFMSRSDLLDLRNELRDEIKTNTEDLRNELKMSRDDLRNEIKANVDTLRNEIQASAVTLRNETKSLSEEVNKRFIEVNNRFDKLESTLIIKLGVMMAASIGIISTIINFSK